MVESFMYLLFCRLRSGSVHNAPYNFTAMACPRHVKLFCVILVLNSEAMFRCVAALPSQLEDTPLHPLYISKESVCSECAERFLKA